MGEGGGADNGFDKRISIAGYTGTAKVHGTIFTNESPDRYKSPASVDFFDGDGNFLFGGDASGTGERIKLD